MANSGTVKWFDRKKGIGFVTPAEGGEDVFIHRRNFTKDTETGKTFILDEGDEIFFNLGTHEGRTTGIEISLPIGTEKKSPRRNRGRVAKKALDDEAAADEASATETGGEGEAPAPAAEGGGGGGGGGGRDSKTHRRGGDRKKRNDKGVGGKGEVSQGQASSRRNDSRSETARAHREVVSLA